MLVTIKPNRFSNNLFQFRDVKKKKKKKKKSIETFLQISSFAFHRRNKVKQVWNKIRLNDK